jgi:hypothetical protein
MPAARSAKRSSIFARLLASMSDGAVADKVLGRTPHPLRRSVQAPDRSAVSCATRRAWRPPIGRIRPASSSLSPGFGYIGARCASRQWWPARRDRLLAEGFDDLARPDTDGRRHDRQMTPEAIDDSLRAAVNAGTIVSFVKGISADEKTDVLFATRACTTGGERPA